MAAAEILKSRFRWRSVDSGLKLSHSFEAQDEVPMPRQGREIEMNLEEMKLKNIRVVTSRRLWFVCFSSFWGHFSLPFTLFLARHKRVSLTHQHGIVSDSMQLVHSVKVRFNLVTGPAQRVVAGDE